EYRQPGEPVVITAEMFYLPIRYHLTERDAAYMYRPHEQKFVMGGSLLSPDEIVNDRDVQGFTSRRVWVVTQSKGTEKESTLPVPSHWVPKREAEFSYLFEYSKLRVVEYEVTGGHGAVKD